MYTVKLSGHGNIDHDENPYLNIVNNEIIEAAVAEANSIEECQSIVRNYIEENGLGGGNWTGGEVFKNGEKVGRISYNGRFWEVGSKYCPK